MKWNLQCLRSDELIVVQCSLLLCVLVISNYELQVINVLCIAFIVQTFEG